MIFNSLTFLVFFGCVMALHYAPFFSWHQKKINLLIASYLFYAAWNPPFVILLWISTVVDWWAAQWMVRAKRERTRKAWMLTSVAVNLGMLGYFKYGGFLLQNFVEIAGSLGIIYHPPGWDIVLPVGISFYTFATLSYTLDVYLRRSKPAGSFLNYALFVTFFPHLVAGPIMRPTELVPQFEEPRQAKPNQIFFGLALLTLGLFQKVVLADGFLAPVVEAVYDAHDKVPGILDSWVATLAFAGQIFCDFAGYSTSAIGIALCLGFAMPDNFRFPYGAVGFSDFWRRWHITLSSWLRDYLYIPLGGNRRGQGRTYMALMGTMLLGGLWHGANWTFVVWGGLHGLYLSAERWLRSRFQRFHSRTIIDDRVGTADLPSRQHYVGLLPREDVRRSGGGVDGHGRNAGQARSFDRGGPNDHRYADRVRHFRNSSGDAQHDAGGGCRAHTVRRHRRHLDDPAVRSDRRAGARQCLHLFRILTPTRRKSAGFAKARFPRACGKPPRTARARRSRYQPEIFRFGRG